jgi:hypothetical protein
MAVKVRLVAHALPRNAVFLLRDVNRHRGFLPDRSSLDLPQRLSRCIEQRQHLRMSALGIVIPALYPAAGLPFEREICVLRRQQQFAGGALQGAYRTKSPCKNE